SVLHDPAETVGGLAARIVFAADETGVAEPVDLVEHKGIVQLLAVRLIARGNAGDLHVPDHGHHFTQVHRHIAMDDLAVKDVELELQVRDLQFADQVTREKEIIEEIAGHAARVDRLEHDVKSLPR